MKITIILVFTFFLSLGIVALNQQVFADTGDSITNDTLKQEQSEEKFNIKNSTKNLAYQIHISHIPKKLVQGFETQWSLKFLKHDDPVEFLSQVQYDILVMDDKGTILRSIAAEKEMSYLYSESGQTSVNFIIKEEPGDVNYTIWVFGLAPKGIIPPLSTNDSLEITVPVYAEMDALSCITHFSDPLCYNEDDLKSSFEDSHWVINLATYLENALITRTEYVNSIQFLIENNIVENKIIDNKIAFQFLIQDIFTIHIPDSLSLYEMNGSRYHSFHVDKVIPRDELRQYWLNEDDQKYWILNNDILTTEHKSSTITKTPKEKCREGLDLPVSYNKTSHIRNNEIFIEKCGMEEHQITDDKIIDSLSVYEKIKRYYYIDIDPNEELWYLDSIIIEKLPIDSKNTLNAEVYNTVSGFLHTSYDIIKSNSYEILNNDKLVKVLKYVKTSGSMGKCSQDHVVLLEFVEEDETWALNARYSTSCNMKNLDKVITEPIFTDVVNSFKIYDYKHGWDIDLSDSPIIEPYDLLYDYDFYINYNPDQWTLKRADGGTSHNVSFFSWKGYEAVEPFSTMFPRDDPKWSLKNINFQKQNSVSKFTDPQILAITIQKVDISGEQLIDARYTVCNTFHPEVYRQCIITSSEEKSIQIQDKPVVITKYVESQYFVESKDYGQHHVFLIDLLDEQQTWVIHAKYVYTPEEIISEDMLLEKIVNSFSVMGYTYDWYSVFNK